MLRKPYTSTSLFRLYRRCINIVKKTGRRYSANKRNKMYFLFAALAVPGLFFALFGKPAKEPSASAMQEQNHASIIDFTDNEPAIAQEVEPEQAPNESILEIKEPSPVVSAPKPDPIKEAKEQTQIAEQVTPSPTPKPVDMDKLVDYYMLEAKEYYGDFGYSSNHYEYTEDDIYMLAQLIYGEARGESTKGKIAVANVVMNRVLARGFPGNSIKAVIMAPNQFTGYSSSIRPNSSCFSAAKQVLEKEVWVLPQDIYYFHSNRSEGENWGSHRFYAKIGAHCFYRESYSGRKRNADIPPALYERIYKWPQYGGKPEKRVSRVQYMLNKLGYKVKADSYFGITTKDALIEFQTKAGLEADGVAGPATIRALIRKFGVEEYLKKYG